MEWLINLIRKIDYQLFAGFVATIALISSVYQIFTTRRHNKLSVKPFLNFNREVHHESKHYKIELVNNGIGPAIITSYSIYFNSQPVTVDILSDEMKFGKILELPGKTQFTVDLPPKNYILSCNDKILLFEVKTDPLFEISHNDIFSKIKIELKYESIYKQKYSVNYSDFYT